MPPTDGGHPSDSLVTWLSTSAEEIYRSWVSEETHTHTDQCSLLCVVATGGLSLSVFIGSAIPIILDKIARGLSARILVVAAYVYILQVVYAVWTSAYNFVPFGGSLTRESSHVLLFFNFLGIYFGVYTASKG